MKLNNSINRLKALELLLVLLAATGLFHLKFGWFMINPFEYEWMLIRGSDVTLDFMAWLFYLKTPWTFPMGMIECYAYPFPLSIVSTSALALLAMPSKILGEVLGLDIFQYFGPWLFLCCLLQGLFGWFILKQVGIKNRYLRLLGTGFFLLSPCWLDRRLHISLFGHWVLLWGILLYFKNRNARSVYPYTWWMYAIFSVLVHPYFVVFSLALSVAAWWKNLPEKRLLSISGLLVGQVILLVFTLYVGGYFHTVKGEGRAPGFGYYSANLNTFFNSLERTASPINLPVSTSGQYEGFAYLGLGGVGLLAMVLVVSYFYPANRTILKNKLKQHLPIGFAALALFCYALSNQVSFFNLVLTIPLPDQLLDILSIFRSSGRFVWLSYYLLLLSLIWFLDRTVSQWKFFPLVVSALLLVQVWDAFPQLERTYYPNNYQVASFNGAIVEEAIKNADQVITFPPYARSVAYPFDNTDFLYLAGRHHIPITAGYFARFDQVKEKPFFDSIYQALSQGRFQDFPGALWIFSLEEVTRFQNTIVQGGLRMHFHRDYGFGFGPGMDIPQSFQKSSEVDNLFKPVQHLSDWLEGQGAEYFLISVKDEATNQLDQKLKSYFRDLGSTAIDSLCFRCGWLAAFGPEGLLVERKGNLPSPVRSTFQISNDRKRIKVELGSAGAEAGNFSEIRLDGLEHSLQKRGLNIVLLNQSLEVIGSWTFDTYISSYIRGEARPLKPN